MMTCTHLSYKKLNELLEVLLKFKDLFNVTLGDWKTKPVSFELESDQSHITAELSLS
jgi:hypothetical protein